MSEPPTELPEAEVRAIKERFHRDVAAVTRADTENLLSRETELRQRAETVPGTWQMLGRQVLLLTDMLKDWYKGVYPLPWRSVAAVTTALLYFLNPFDIVPDVIPGVGLLDDVMVLAICMRLIKNDLRTYVQTKGLCLDDYGL